MATVCRRGRIQSVPRPVSAPGRVPGSQSVFCEQQQMNHNRQKHIYYLSSGQPDQSGQRLSVRKWWDKLSREVDVSPGQQARLSPGPTFPGPAGTGTAAAQEERFLLHQSAGGPALVQP